MNPSVTGFLRDPSIVTILPWWTVTESEQASGQSSGQALSSTDAGPPRGAFRTSDWTGTGMAVRYQIRNLQFRFANGLRTKDQMRSPHVVIIGGGFGGL